MVGSNILPNVHDTNDYLGADMSCAVARCCQATGRTGIFETIFRVRVFMHKLTLY